MQKFELMQKKYFIFDLDNTLVKTNRANNKSYEEAIKNVLGIKLQFKNKTSRFTRKNLTDISPQIATSQISEIIKCKEEIYIQHIHETILNVQLVKCLMLLKDMGEETILLTECHKERALQLCNYYNLGELFSHKYYLENYNGINKYLFIRNLNVAWEAVVLFENDRWEIQKAKQIGISKNQIITIKF